MTLSAAAPLGLDSTIAEPPVVSVDIRHHESHSLKVTWHHDQGGSYPPYLVDPAPLMHYAGVIRQKLSPLIIAARKDGRAFGPALKDIARGGQNLYDALFLESAGSRGLASEIRDDLESRSSPCRILIKVEPRIHIPWGLLYCEPGDRISESGLIEDLGGFACLKHHLSTIHSRIPVLPKPRKDVPFQLLPVFNKRSFESARGILRPDEQEFVDELMRRFSEPTFSKSAFEQRWRTTALKFGLIYFYCHANGKELALDLEDRVDIFTLRLLGNESPDASERVCLLFMNGCATAVGSPDGGFLEAASHSGFCGFIGTEAKIPDVFALRFGTAFLHLFLTSGLPLWRVMQILWRQHWPLSLLYGIYGNPLIRVGSESELAPLPPALCGNFSSETVGTNDMEGITPWLGT